MGGVAFVSGFALGLTTRRRRDSATICAAAAPKRKAKVKAAPSGKKLVIVESPAKAKTIGKMLPVDEYIVESCVGHVRDLASKKTQLPEKFRSEPWAKLGVNVDENFKPIYVLKEGKQKIMNRLKGIVDSASEVVLATDEDREGEAISWHLMELLKSRLQKRGCKVRRAVFHEITPAAIKKSFSEFREVDMDLVAAQETRRIVDRLAGFTMSPVLWKKIARGLSAGRVQSVALDLIVKREMERFEFLKNSYYGLEAIMIATGDGDAGLPFSAYLASIASPEDSEMQPVAQGKDFEGDRKGLSESALQAGVVHLDQEKAEAQVVQIQAASFVVADVSRRKTTRKPPTPFITSTLQQEAHNKLGLSVGVVMRLAQDLYEQGYITYMRTDNPMLSESAKLTATTIVTEFFGAEYLVSPDEIVKAKKPKNAQEAHEAIRPAGEYFRKPIETALTGSALNLYNLIYSRTLASQMTCAQINSTSVTISAILDNKIIANMKTTGSVLKFAGFMKAYEYALDTKNPTQSLLPDLALGDNILMQSCTAISHETRPPGRFSEASLVKNLEACGVGRPSTYASIIETLVEREYVTRSLGKALVPTLTAFAVDGLLARHCPSFVDTEFTADMEQVLDDIASGTGDRLDYLTAYYWGNEGLVKLADKVDKEVTPADVRRVLLPSLSPLEGKIDVIVGPYGPYVVENESGRKNSIPKNTSPDELTPSLIEQILSRSDNPSIGIDPDSGKEVLLKLGPYGSYVQLGEDIVPVADSKKKKGSPASAVKAKRASLLPGMEPDSLSLEMALSLLSLPRLVGMHPDRNQEIRAGLGRFGPFLQYNDSYISVPKEEDIFDIKIEKALELISTAEAKGKLSRSKDLGSIKGTSARIKKGKYGTYIQIGKKNLKLPSDTEFDDFTIEMAKELLAASASKK